MEICTTVAAREKVDLDKWLTNNGSLAATPGTSLTKLLKEVTDQVCMIYSGDATFQIREYVRLPDTANNYIPETLAKGHLIQIKRYIVRDRLAIENCNLPPDMMKLKAPLLEALDTLSK